MEYRRNVELTVRDAVRNSIGLLAVSLVFSAAFVPFASSILLSNPLAWLAGFWTSCLLAGVVGVASFRLTTEIAARHESIPTTPFWRGLREDWPAGLAVGAVSFCLVALSAVLANLSLAGLAGHITVVIGAYAIIGWGLLLSFALPIYARTGDALPDGDGQGSPFPIRRGRFALRAGLEVLVTDPVATLWLLVQAAGWSFIAVVTLITPVLLLPGFLSLLAAEIAELTVPWERLAVESPVPILGFD